VFAVSSVIIYGAYLVFPTEAANKLLSFLESLPSLVWSAIISTWDAVRNFDYIGFIKAIPYPSEWGWEDKNWNPLLKFEFYFALITTALFVVDILFSSEKKRGNVIMLIPTLTFCAIYSVISIHAQVTGLLSSEVYLSLDAAEIGEKIFRHPEMVVMTFTHLFALDLGLAFIMMKDFYKRTTSRQRRCRLVMVFLVLFTIMQGLKSVPLYLFFRATLFKGPEIKVETRIPTNRNTYLREYYYLMDPVPEGASTISRWLSIAPAPLDTPVVTAIVLVGAVRFFVVLAIYLLYVLLVCFPVSALLCLYRNIAHSKGQVPKGALYSPFEGTAGKKFPPKAALVITGHLRLFCLRYRDTLFFKIFFEWWLINFLDICIMYEFTFPFRTDFSPYMAFLMEEFGDVYPMGGGLGFGKYTDVKAILENPDLRKGGVSLAFSTSSVQQAWSKNNSTNLPTKEVEKPIVDEARELVRVWIDGLGEKMANPTVRRRLDGILSFQPKNGKPLEKILIEASFGSTLFHLLTDGELTEEERKAYHRLHKNGFPLISDVINRVWFGGALSYSGVQDYGTFQNVED